jgi:iron complex outermembrane receptor protein
MLAVALGAALAPQGDRAWSAGVAGGGRSAVLEEVIVTARRRDESAIALPMAITALDGDTLAAMQYRTVDEFVSLSPGVQVYTAGDGVSSQLTIRGVVTPGEYTEPGNAIYVDEVYVSGMRTLLPGFYDIASVQLLKGPQAGVYGRNTIGGALLITTGQPTGDHFARLDASYAQYDEKNVNGTLNMPLTDAVRLRATGWHNDRDGGWYESAIDGRNIDAWRDSGGRVTVAILPNERSTLTLTGEYNEADQDYAGFAGLVKGARLGPPPLAPESRRNVLRDDLGGARQHWARVNGKLDVDTGAGSFIAVAGWRELKAREPGSDGDGTAWSASYEDYLAGGAQPAPWAPQLFTRDDRDTSSNAELRFLTADDGGPFSAMLGVSYFHENGRFFDQLKAARDFALILAATGRDGSSKQFSKQDTTSWAGFSEVIWTPREAIEITADLRYTRDRKSIRFAQTTTGFFSLISAPTTTLDASETFDNWSPGITLAYKPDEALNLYAKYIRGFHAGGFNTVVNNPALLTYDPEEADSYELGVKALVLDQRLQLGASVFYLRIDNALVPQSDPGTPPVTVQQNVAAAQTTGLEVDLTAKLTDELSMIASAGAYENSVSRGGPLGLDRRPFVPEYTASLVANVEHPLADGLTGIARLGYRHRSGGLVLAPSELGLKLDSYNLLDAQLGIRRGNLELTVFVRNALDNHYESGNYFLSTWQVIYSAAGGLDPITTRAAVRNPGSVLGVRLTAVF